MLLGVFILFGSFSYIVLLMPLFVFVWALFAGSDYDLLAALTWCLTPIGMPLLDKYEDEFEFCLYVGVVELFIIAIGYGISMRFF